MNPKLASRCLAQLFNAAVVLTVLTASSAVSTARAETEVGGLISHETWTKASSPYVVTNHVQVTSLTIEAGVSIQFREAYVFEVAGKISAKGTKDAPITFSRGATGRPWQGIFFNNSLRGSELEFCNITGSTNSGVRIFNTILGIRNCVIVSNSAPFGGGIWADVLSGDLALDTCTIAHNTSSNPDTSSHWAGAGGGLYAKMYNNRLELTCCTFTNNTVIRTQAGTASGGGVHVESGDAIIVHSFISNNFCESKVQYGSAAGQAYGGGLALWGGKLTLNNCTVSANTARVPVVGGNDEGAFGGGVYVGVGTVNMANSIIDANSVSAYVAAIGGGVCFGYHRDSPKKVGAQLSNCIVAHNGEEGLSLGGGSTATLLNCTIVYNAKQGIEGNNGCSANLTNCILYFNAANGSQIEGSLVATVTYSDVYGGYAGVGNINYNPLLLGGVDLEIVEDSPCIDAGNPAAEFNDIAFPPSLGTVRNDMGAHGGPGAALGYGPQVRDRDVDGLLDAWELQYFGDLSAGPDDDLDADKLVNLKEQQYGTDPTRGDTDADGYADGSEVRSGSDPLDAGSTPPPVLTMTVEQVKLSFAAAVGQVNLIQASMDLAEWTTIEEVIGTGDTIDRIYTVTESRRYFRLRRP